MRQNLSVQIENKFPASARTVNINPTCFLEGQQLLKTVILSHWPKGGEGIQYFSSQNDFGPILGSKLIAESVPHFQLSAGYSHLGLIIFKRSLAIGLFQ